MAERTSRHRGRADRTRSTRPGDRRRAGAPSNSKASAEVADEALDAADPVATAAGFGDEVVGTANTDEPQESSEVDESTDDAGSEQAPVTRVRSARGARTNSIRPGLTQSALHRMRGVNPRHAVIMAVVLAFVILTLAMPLRTYFSQQAEFDQLRESNAQLRKEVADYQQKVNEQGDPAYTEAKARARLQYARPGETVLVLTFPGQAQRKAEEDRAAAKARNPWYGNLWDSVATPVAGK